MNQENPSQKPDASGQTSSFPLAVITQYLKDFSFENPGGHETLLNLKEMPTGNIRVDVKVEPKTPPTVEVILFLSVEAKIQDKIAYHAECEYAGLFRVGRIDQDHVLPLVLIEAPRLLFPFARQIIANAIQAGNFPPLLVNPIDFAALYREKQEELAKQQQALQSKAAADKAKKDLH